MISRISNAVRRLILRLVILGLAPLTLVYAPQHATIDRGSCKAAIISARPML